MSNCDCKDERRDHGRADSHALCRDAEDMAQTVDEHLIDKVSGRVRGDNGYTMQDLLGFSLKMNAQALRMIIPLYRSFNNGGLPSKPAGKRHKLGKMEFTKWQAAKFLAVVIMTGCALVVTTKVSTMDFSISTKGVVLHTDKVAHE